MIGKNGAEYGLGDLVTWHSWRYKGEVVGVVDEIRQFLQCKRTYDRKTHEFIESPKYVVTKVHVYPKCNHPGTKTEKQYRVYFRLAFKPQHLTKYNPPLTHRDN